MREKDFLPLIKDKLNIDELNDMQRRMLRAATESNDIVLLSPTGSGKTLAFILPTLKMLKPASGRIQVAVIAPSRELVIQITGIFKAIASGYKTTALYGGHNTEDEINSLSAGTDIVVATPGRLLDHANRRNIDLITTRILILDEFDKSLELGFEKEMKKIMVRLKNVSHTILTSATRADVIPDFIPLKNELVINFLSENQELQLRMHTHRVDCDGRDKLNDLLKLLHDLASHHDGREHSIVFVNHRESAERVADFLQKHGIPAILYHGQLDQRERETAIAMFNNGSRPVLVATDLAARGLDIEGVRSIIHYHQALTAETYTHRNGRTARIDREGDIYVMIGPDEDIKPYVDFDDTYYPDDSKEIADFNARETIYISAGRKEKLSKGDILGFLIKEGNIPASDVGKIDVFDHYALASVNKDVANALIGNVKGKKIKGEKRIISLIKN